MLYLSNHLFFNRNNLLVCAQTGQGSEKPFFTISSGTAADSQVAQRGWRNQGESGIQYCHPWGATPGTRTEPPHALKHSPVPGLHHKEILLGKRGILKATWERKMGTDPKHLKKAISPLTMMLWQMSPSLPAVPRAGKHSRLILQNTDLLRTSFSPFLLMY